MKMRVKKEFEQLKEILPLGYETNLNLDSDATKMTFLGKNGEEYSISWIEHFIGYVPLNEIFEKI